jgi:DMSO/TMAO reductase YedYZ molybdopterin-dependent catalytic subunit
MTELSRQMRRLDGAWKTGTNWPQWLEWIEIQNIRGWSGQRFEMRFPIMAVVGENGVGKSTVLQAAASIYNVKPASGKERFASHFFPDTPWDHVHDAHIRYAVREGDTRHPGSVRKPTADGAETLSADSVLSAISTSVGFSRSLTASGIPNSLSRR